MYTISYMNENIGNNVIDFTAEAMRRLDSNAVSLEAKRHIIDLLRRQKMVVGMEAGRSTLPPSALDLEGQNEIIYYALLLKDPSLVKWDSQSTQPRPERNWIDISHPKVQAAQDLLQAFPEKMGNVTPQGEIIGTPSVWWLKANEEERKRLVLMLLADPNVTKWFSHDGRYPAPDVAVHLRLDNLNLMEYLPPEWQTYVQNELDAWKKKHGGAGHLS